MLIASLANAASAVFGVYLSGLFGRLAITAGVCIRLVTVWTRPVD